MTEADSAPADVQPAAVLLVHGAWHGPWCWERVQPLLHDRGIRTLTVDLPTCDRTRGGTPTLYDDAATAADAIAGIDGPVIVVGHSYGGCVITEACDGAPNVCHLVYLAAFMPDAGESARQLLDGRRNTELLAGFRNAGDGWLSYEPTLVHQMFYNDCDAATAQWAADNLRPMHGGAGDPVRNVAWREIPSTFVVTAQDRVILPELQREMAKRATHVVEWPTSHSPFASQPQLVADLISDIAHQAPDRTA